MNKKLIYILNHYSIHTEQHFFHVLHLLEIIADKGVKIALVIEKSEDTLKLHHPNISLFPQKQTTHFFRTIELFSLLWKLQKQGYKKSFVRISWVAASISICVGFFSGLQTYYWLSGQGGTEAYNEMSWGKSKFKLWLSSKIPFWFIKTFTYRFVTGPESMKDYAINVMGVKSSKITILYNDIDLKRFAYQPNKTLFKNAINIDANNKIILFVHRFSPVRKSLFYLPYIVDAFYKKEIKDWKFIFVGGGPEAIEAKALLSIHIEAGKVIWLGSIPNAEIDKLYKAADIFINPTYAEGFPRVLIEAMACGLPVVTTDPGGIKDIIGEKQSQYVVNKNDRDAFAERLIYLAQDSLERIVLQEENLKIVQRFSTEAVADMYIKKIFP